MVTNSTITAFQSQKLFYCLSFLLNYVGINVGFSQQSQTVSEAGPQPSVYHFFYRLKIDVHATNVGDGMNKFRVGVLDSISTATVHSANNLQHTPLSSSDAVFGYTEMKMILLKNTMYQTLTLQYLQKLEMTLFPRNVNVLHYKSSLLIPSHAMKMKRMLMTTSAFILSALKMMIQKVCYYYCVSNQ